MRKVKSAAAVADGGNYRAADFAHDENPARRGSIFADETHRRESVAALKNNVTGE